MTSVVDGKTFRYEQVTEIELDAEVPHELTAPPPDAEAVPPTGGARDPEDVAARHRARSALTDVAPARLPLPDRQRRRPRRGAAGDVDLLEGPREFVQLFESQDKPVDDDPYEWERVQHDGRTVFITDAGDANGQRIAHTTVAGTRAVVYATLPPAELLDLAFNLEVVR